MTAHDRLDLVLVAMSDAAAAGVETRCSDGARLDPFGRLVEAGVLRVDRGWLTRARCPL